MNRSKYAYVLHHEYEWCGRDESKLIGLYATKRDAEEAAALLKHQPGFCDWPDGFTIDKYHLNQTHWTEGFFINVNILVPSTGEDEFLGAATAWRPGDCYEIHHIDAGTDSQVTGFSVGDVVRCEERNIDGIGQGLLVAAKVLSRKL